MEWKGVREKVRRKPSPLPCRSRAGGNPETFFQAQPRDFENDELDSRLLFRHSRESGNPETFSPAQPHDFKNDELDSRLRGNDGGGRRGNGGDMGLRRNGWDGILRGNGAEYGTSTSRARPSPPGQTFPRHSRAGGNPESFSPAQPHDFENNELDSRLRGNDGVGGFRGSSGGGGAGITKTGGAGMVGTGAFVGLARRTARAHAECAP